MVMVELQLASTLPPEAEGTLMGGASALSASEFGGSEENLKVVDMSLRVEKSVVGCTKSTWS